jgi:hypothetical protein
MAELCLKAGWIYKAVLFTLEASQCMLDVGEMNPRWVMWGVIKFRGDKSCWGCSAQNAGSLNNNKQIYHLQKDTVGPICMYLMPQRSKTHFTGQEGNYVPLVSPRAIAMHC